MLIVTDGAFFIELKDFAIPVRVVLGTLTVVPFHNWSTAINNCLSPEWLGECLG